MQDILLENLPLNSIVNHNKGFNIPKNEFVQIKNQESSKYFDNEDEFKNDLKLSFDYSILDTNIENNNNIIECFSFNYSNNDDSTIIITEDREKTSIKIKKIRKYWLNSKFHLPIIFKFKKKINNIEYLELKDFSKKI